MTDAVTVAAPPRARRRSGVPPLIGLVVVWFVLVGAWYTYAWEPAIVLIGVIGAALLGAIGLAVYGIRQRARGWVALASGAALIILASAWWFNVTRDPTMVVAALLACAVLVLGGWVWRDARRVGLPPAPWVVVVAVLLVLGLALYLVARELRISLAAPAS